MVVLVVGIGVYCCCVLGSTGGSIERQDGRGSNSFFLSRGWFLVLGLGIETRCAEQERKVEEGSAAVPKGEEKRGLAKSLMRTSRSCAVVWYGTQRVEPRCRTMCRPRRGRFLGRWWWPGDANWQLRLLARTGCRRDDGRYPPLQEWDWRSSHGCHRSQVAVGWTERLLANTRSDLGVLHSLINLSPSLSPSSLTIPFSRSAFHKPP